MRLLRLYLILSMWTIGSSEGSSQYQEDVVFDHITIQDGLSHNSITTILQDHYGYMWIGTQNGLNRYDGNQFKVFNSEKSCTGNCFKGKSIESMLEDSAGNLWVGTRYHGINLKKADTDQFMNIDSIPGVGSIHGFEITELYEDQKGNIWIGILRKGLVRYIPSSNTYQLFNSENSGLLRDLVFSVIEDSRGKLYVKTAGYGLHVLGENDQFDQIHVDKYQSPNMDGYRATMIVEDNFLWIGMEGTGLYKMNLDNRHFAHFTDVTEPIQLTSTSIRDIVITEDNRIYFGTDGGGLGLFDERRQKVQFFQAEGDNEKALNSNAIQCLMEDNAGNIWIGTFNGGLNIIKKNQPRFQKYDLLGQVTKNTQLPSVLAIHQGEDDKIWVGTDGNGLYAFDSEKKDLSAEFKNDPTISSIRGNVIKSIYESQEGEIWSGTFSKGISIYNKEDKTFTSIYGRDLEYQNIWTIEEDAKGRIWLGTIGDGIYIVEDGDIIVHHKHGGSYPESPASNDIMTIFRDNDDNMWVGHGKRGLDLWVEEDKIFKHFQHNSYDTTSISDDEIRSIFQDSKDRIWVGTEGGGLNRMHEDGTFRHYGIEDGLIADNILAIEEDDFGNLWMSSFSGITRFNPENKSVLNYSFRSKKQYNQFNQESILKDKEGLIYFGGINGIEVIDPNNVQRNKAESHILFSEFRIFNRIVSVGESIGNKVYLERPIEETKEIKIYHTDKAFTLGLATNDFVSVVEEPIQYRMIGFNDSWQNVIEGKHSITYTNLDYGHYTLEVKYRDSKAELDVHVIAPFWNTWWFKIVTALLLIIGISFLLRLLHFRRLDNQKKKLLEKEKEFLEMENYNLEENINVSNSKLLSSTAQMAHKNEILLDIKQELVEFQKDPKKNLQTVIRKLDYELKNEDYWKEFNIYFEKVDKKFTNEILRIHPDLTQNDLKICTFIRLNMNTKDISSLLNISVRGVEKGRYRLKKRLELSAEQDLIQYVRSIHPDDAR